MNKTIQAMLAYAMAMLCWLPAASGAQTIVDAAYVQAALQRGVQVWDVRDASDYAKGHLPGALSLGDAAKLLRDPNTEDFMPIPRLEAMLGAAGIDPARETVVYGSRGTWNAYFGRYTLRYFGGDKVTVFHDGIEAWQAAGLPVSNSAAHNSTVQLKLVPHPSVAVTTAEVIRQLNNPSV